MAQTAPTTTSEFAGFIKPTEAGDIFAEVRKSSVVQQLARKIPIGANGVEIAYTTSKPTAAWVAEAGKKPTTSGGKALRKIGPKKLAAISVILTETVRANPGGYINDLKLDIAEAFTLAFDAARYQHAVRCGQLPRGDDEGCRARHGDAGSGWVFLGLVPVRGARYQIESKPTSLRTRQSASDSRAAGHLYWEDRSTFQLAYQPHNELPTQRTVSL